MPYLHKYEQKQTFSKNWSLPDGQRDGGVDRKQRFHIPVLIHADFLTAKPTYGEGLSRKVLSLLQCTTYRNSPHKLHSRRFIDKMPFSLSNYEMLSKLYGTIFAFHFKHFNS